MSDGGLRQLFQKHFPTWHWQSVETWSTGQGVPDLNYCAKGAEGWIELKLATANAVRFRSEQIGWAERRIRAGGRVFLAVRQQRAAGPRTEARDALWLFDGTEMRAVMRYGLSGSCPLLFSPGGPAQWDWPRAQDLLLDRQFSRLPTI